MKIYSNGKDRVLTGQFPQRFRLRNNGMDVPFIRTSQGSVRLTGEIPEGDIDVLEVIREKAPTNPSLTTDLKFVMINESEVDRIEKLSMELEEKGNAFEKKGEILEKHAQNLLTKEDKNGKELEKTNATIENLAKAIGKEIQADRESIKATASQIEGILSENVEVLDGKLKEHEVAKNPHKITKATIGLDAVDNTSDMDKPISKAVKKALDKKADKEEITELDQKIEEVGKKHESFVKSYENANLYGGVGGMVAGSSVPDGGTTGQVLTKKSDLNGDVEWANSSGGGFNIDGGYSDSIYTDQQIIDGGNS